MEEFSSFPLLARLLHLEAPSYRLWLSGVGLAVLALAVRGMWEDPVRPYWPAGATLAVSAMAGAIAVRSRMPGYAYVSGFLVSLAGAMIWVASPPATLRSLGYIQVLCFALASWCWSALELILPSPAPALAGRKVLVLAEAFFGLLDKAWCVP